MVKYKMFIELYGLNKSDIKQWILNTHQTSKEISLDPVDLQLDVSNHWYGQKVSLSFQNVCEQSYSQ